MTPLETALLALNSGSGSTHGALDFLLPCNEPAGATTALDISGKGMNGTYGVSMLSEPYTPTGQPAASLTMSNTSSSGPPPIGVTVPTGASFNNAGFTLGGFMMYQMADHKNDSGPPNMLPFGKIGYAANGTRTAHFGIEYLFGTHLYLMAEDNYALYGGGNTVPKDVMEFVVMTWTQGVGGLLYTTHGQAGTSFPMITATSTATVTDTVTPVNFGILVGDTTPVTTTYQFQDLFLLHTPATPLQVKQLFVAAGQIAPPGAPTATISTAGGTDTVTIASAVTPGTLAVAGYQLSSSTTSGNELLNIFAASTTNTTAPVTFATLSPTTSSVAGAYYVVRAFDDAGNLGPPSNEVQSAVNPILSPVNAAGVAGGGGGAVSVTTSLGATQISSVTPTTTSLGGTFAVSNTK